MDDETVDGMAPAEQEIWNAGFNEAVRLGAVAADDVTVAMVEIKALRADLKAVAVALEISVICIETARRAIAESSGPLIPGGPIVEHLIYARKVLDRPGVKEILKSG